MCRINQDCLRCFGIGLIAMVLAAQAAAVWAQSEHQTIKTTGALRIRVVDAAGEPMPDAKIMVNVGTKEDFKAVRNFVSDAEGAIDVKLPGTLDLIRLWASRPGHVPLFVQLWPNKKVPGDTLPGEFTFRLPHGTTIGGVVQNEKGQPIAGTRVEVKYDSGAELGQDELARVSDWLANGSDAVTTNDQGRWSLDNVPAGDGVQLSLKLSHADYISDKSWGELQQQNRITTRSLRDGDGAIVMQRGIAVKGKVTDPQGQPVQRAVVLWAESPWDAETKKVLTDAEGKYRLPPLPAGQVNLTVIANGWMPEKRKLALAADASAANFQLQPGRKLRLRLVDNAGKPVPGATVYIERWRGGESLFNLGNSVPPKNRVPRIADDGGIYEWDWAPADAVTCKVMQDGYANSEITLAADGEEHVHVMYPVLHLSGSVTDAATGQPVKTFSVLPVIYFSPVFPLLDRRHRQEASDGKYRLEFERSDIEHGVQIEAPGYMTVRSEGRCKIGEPHRVFDFQLQPTGPHRGRVVDEQGQPVAGAKVYVATGFQHLDLTDLSDSFASEDSNQRVRTDQDGTFEIVPQMERYDLVAVVADGYGQVSRQAAQSPGEIRIQRLASVKGRLSQAGQPVGSQRILLEPIAFEGGDAPRISNRFSATTEADGTFVFPRVPPIACRVRPFLHFSVESPLKSSQSIPLLPQPGEEVAIELGAEGAEIIGQLALEGQDEQKFDYHYSLTYLVARRPGIDPPPALAAKGFDWQTGWSDAWRWNQEGQAYLNTLHYWFVKPDPDGRFRISGVPPGDYQFAVALYGETAGCLVHPLGQRVFPVTVKPNDSTLDLATLSIPSLAIPKVGDLAADFPLVNAGGQQTTLARLRGQTVLVDFWATWCGPCVAGLDKVEHLRRQLGDEKLAVIGVNLDADQQQAREFLAGRELRWGHALLGDWSATDIPKRYAVTMIPAYVLIGPDGRILAQDSDLEKIAEVLGQADVHAAEKRGK